MTRVIGLGNVLMSDDGLGPFVARVLDATYECPPGVEFVDAGTPGLDLTPFLIDCDAVVFVDTVTSSGAPGEVRVYDRDAILRVPPQTRTGGHDPALKEALLTVAAAGTGPSSVTLIGVIPEWVATGVELSDPVRAAIQPVIAAVLFELERFGASVRPRRYPRNPETWWAPQSGEAAVAAV
jgi:hydrogenase maturation protease